MPICCGRAGVNQSKCKKGRPLFPRVAEGVVLKDLNIVDFKNYLVEMFEEKAFFCNTKPNVHRFTLNF